MVYFTNTVTCIKHTKKIGENVIWSHEFKIWNYDLKSLFSYFCECIYYMCDRLIVFFLIKNGKVFFFRDKMGKVIYIYIYIFNEISV